MTKNQLENVLTFTTALADRIEQENKIDFGAMETTDESLQEVEKSAREYAARRKKGLAAKANYGITPNEQAEIDEIRNGIREFYKATRKAVNG